MSTGIEYNPRARRGLVSYFTDPLTELGSVVLRSIETVGDITLFAWQTLKWLMTRLPNRETLYNNMYQIGVLSLPVVALTGTFIGIILAVQSYNQFRAFGLETQLGGVINRTMLRELGPVLAATMLAGRVGSAMAAELGTMRVTEQIDALSSMGANPIHYLVVPRFLSCLLLIPSLTIMAVFCGVVGGAAFCIFHLNIDMQHYSRNAKSFVETWDLIYGVIKSVFFGATIGILSCYRGFHCKAGAEGVGQAATSAFVQSFVMIITLDLFLSIGLDQIYNWIWPDSLMLPKV